MARTSLKASLFSLILGFFIATPIARFYGQGKPQIAPPSKSDSLDQDEIGNTVRVQHREIPATNFRIAGVDLAAPGDFLDQVMGVLGQTRDEGSDDDDFRDEVCYRSAAPHDTTHLIFGQGDLEQFFKLSSDASAWIWQIPCKPSAKITRDLATASGLHLGQTEEQVIAILGLPSSHIRDQKTGLDEMKYSLETKKNMSAQDLAPYLKEELKHNPKLDQHAWIENNGSYHLWVSVDAIFRSGHLTSLKILWSNGV